MLNKLSKIKKIKIKEVSHETNELVVFQIKYKSTNFAKLYIINQYKNLFEKKLLNFKKSQRTAALVFIFFFCLSWSKIRTTYFKSNWIYTTNHKRIAVNYFWFVILSGIVGMVLATLIRLEFAYPGVGIFVGDSLQYLSLASAHGVVMVFFMIMPLLFGAFANFLLPTQLGVHDVAFPRLNSAAFWFLPGGLLMLCQLVCVDRRYQRMNCFNIREIQAILKKRFFIDLLNHHDHHLLLNNIIAGLRYKIEAINEINSNMYLFYNYGIQISPKIRVNHSLNNLNNSKYSSYSSANIKIFSFVNFFINFKIFYYFNLLYIQSTSFFKKTLIIPLFQFLTNYDELSSYERWLDFFEKKIEQVKQFIEFLTSNPFKTLFVFIRNQIITLLLNYNKEIIILLIKFELFKLYIAINYTNKIDFYKIFNYLLWFPFNVVLQTYFIFVQSFIFMYTTATLKIAQFVKTKTKNSTNLFNLSIKDAFSTIFNLNTLNQIFFIEVKNLIFIYKTFSNTIFFFIFGEKTSCLPFFLPISEFKNIYLMRVFNNNKFNSFFLTKYFNNTDNNLVNLLSNEEISTNNRYNRFSNPSFKYDYKSGDYFPKIYKEVYTHLFTTYADLYSIAKSTPWFTSEKYKEILDLNFSPFFDNIVFKSSAKSFLSHKNELFWYSNTDGFYNFYFQMLINFDTKTNTYKWVNLFVLNQKFYKMFHTSSMQQRVLSNWRQLKFTREAWRCKLLAARHQKTLFKRYLNEDGVFWSIERNAKDLLPGWAMITPFSSRTRFTAVGKTDIGLIGVLLVLNSSIISAANFLVTYRYLSTLNNRKMRDARAFFTEGVMVASWMMVTANPMLVIGIIMLLSDRHWQTSFFDYSGGGDTVLFQHMFWFFGHPEVYVIIIPTFGFTNTILSYYLKKRVSARASLMYSMYTIAFLGFFVWGHHMYMVGLAHTTRMLFSTLTVMISVPAATKIMHWCVTMVNSSFATELPLLFAITFIFFFISGGISGMAVAHTGMDVLFHDTFYVIGHFHVMLAGAAMFSSFGAFYFYFPAIFGVKYSRIYAYLHYSYYLLGQLMTVIPMFWLGYAGMPRRVLDYPTSFGGWHSVISAGHMLSVAGLMAFFIMIFDSLRQAKAVIRNTFGVSRYNIRFNFYLFEIAHLNYVQQKGLFLFKFIKPKSIKLNGKNYTNFEVLETTLISYIFESKNSLK